MAIAHDASSPAATTGIGNPTLTSASFTPPAGSRIVVKAGDCSTGSTKTFSMTNTGMGGSLTWTKMAGNATEACDLWISSEVVSATAGTVSVTSNPSPGTVAQWDFVASVWTGMETGAISIGTHVVGAVNNGGTSTTNSITPNAITTTFNNSQVVGGDIDDSAAGAMTSTDSNTPATPASTGDGIFVWKAANTATSGTVVTLNFDAAGTGLVAHRWVAAELLPPPSGDPFPAGYQPDVRQANVYRM